MTLPSRKDDDILREVRERFTYCSDWESSWRDNAKADLAFEHADARNHGQWDEAQYSARTSPGSAPRPCLVINKTAQHVLQVKNDARQNQMGVKINATGFGASEKAAEAIEGIIRHIESQSNAQQNAYNCAIAGQVGPGIGWVHITTDYVQGADTFDQDLFLESVPNILTVYSDPDTREPDHSDMQWAMLVTTMTRAQFDRDYPKEAGNDDDPLGAGEPFGALDGEEAGRDWDSKESVRVARYYRKSEKKVTLWNVPAASALQSNVPLTGATAANGVASSTPGTNTATTFPSGPTRETDMPEELIDLCRKMDCQKREMFEAEVEWFLIGGSRILDSGMTVFQHIPLVPFIGIETVLEGKLDRKGLVRALIDPQRMLNWNASKAIEALSTQTVTPYLGDVRAFEGLESYWETANVINRPFLPYNATSLDDGTPIPPPSRIDPPQASSGFMEAMQYADTQMQMVTGQYQAEMGAPGNERSGRAINERQRQSDTANYHYTDNQGMALRLIGRILVEALPKVYDTARAITILGLDGTQQQAVVDPNLQTAHQVVTPDGQPDPSPDMDPDDAMEMQGAILAVNPTIGRYTVEADVGPSFATKRQEAFSDLMQAIGMAPELMGKIGDLLFKCADFPLADEIADRLKPASQDPALMALQQQLHAATAQIGQLQQALKDKQADIAIKQADLGLKQQQITDDREQMRHGKVHDIMTGDVDRSRAQLDVYKAETDRAAALGDIDPGLLMPVVQQLVEQILGRRMTPAETADSAPAHEAVPEIANTNRPGGEVRDPVPSAGDVT